MENKISYRDFLALNWSKNRQNVPTELLSRIGVKIQGSKHRNNYLIKESRRVPLRTATASFINKFNFLKRNVNNSYITLPFFTDDEVRVQRYRNTYLSNITWSMFTDSLFRCITINKKTLDGECTRYTGYIGNGLIFYYNYKYNEDTLQYYYSELTVLAALTTTNEYHDYVKDSAVINPSVLSLYVKDDFDVVGSGYGTLRTMFRKIIKKECIDLGIDIVSTDDLNMFVEYKEFVEDSLDPHKDVNDFNSVNMLNTLANEFIKREITPDVANIKLISII